MQIVINISKRVYDDICDGVENADICGIGVGTVERAIAEGIPLPKGHWIHRMQDGGCYWEECSVCHTERAFPTKYCPDCGTYMYADIRADAPTIIEADKEIKE